MSAADRRLVAAARAARKFVAQSRWAVIEGHSRPAGSRVVSSVRDKYALAWIAEHDQLLAKLDAAIAKVTGSAA